ncbi:MAG: DinB family protein [Anaerolineales bacterium]|nr:DinB family protein [Anaerolineales bacterium]
MNLKDVLFMFEYNYWGNKKILTACKNITQEQFLAPADYPFGGLRGTLLHVVDGERLWRVLFETQRVTEDEDLIADDFPNFDSLEKKFQEEEKLMRAYLSKLKDEDMESHLKYTTTEGVHRDRILWHCFYHLINHGTQHRAEAAALLTNYGSSPGDLDVTVFLNEMKK